MPVTLDGSRPGWERVERQCRSTRVNYDFAAPNSFVGGCRRFKPTPVLILFLVLSFMAIGHDGAADMQQTDPHPEQPLDIGALRPGTPRTVADHNNHAIELAKIGQLDAAIAELSLALELAPEDYIAHFNRGNFYLRLKDTDRAIADFTQVIRVRPNFAAKTGSMKLSPISTQQNN